MQRKLNLKLTADDVGFIRSQAAASGGSQGRVVGRAFELARAHVDDYASPAHDSPINVPYTHRAGGQERQEVEAGAEAAGASLSSWLRFGLRLVAEEVVAVTNAEAEAAVRDARQREQGRPGVSPAAPGPDPPAMPVVGPDPPQAPGREVRFRNVEAERLAAKQQKIEDEAARAPQRPTFVYTPQERAWSPFVYYSQRSQRRNRRASVRDWEREWDRAMHVFLERPDWDRN